MMACGLSKSLGFSSSLKKQQGIVTILGGSSISSAPSLRRTFSADLSSKNWLTQNGTPPMKRISSSEKLHNFGATDSLSSQDEEHGSRSGVDIWTQIQEDKNKKEHETEPSQTDVWSSILSDKKKMTDTETVPPPYVHPLVKRASSLSEKSLEICTESLGSETGCEGFSSYASSETGEAEENLVLEVTVTKEEEETEFVVEVEQEQVTVPNQTSCMEMPRGSFPPPIRSLSSQSGSALHMKTRRDNGRLVLEAVSMPSHNNFSAKRQDGRLLLTFAEIEEKEDETDEVQWFDEEEEVEEAQDEWAYKPNGLLYKVAQKPIGPITVHRLACKPIGVPKINSRWPATDEFETKTDMSTPVVHSLPPRPRVAQLARSMKPPSTVDDTVGAACFNTCDYSWKPTNNEVLGGNTKPQFQAQDYVHKSMGVVVTHDLINGCKEPRRSLLSVEPSRSTVRNQTQVLACKNLWIGQCMYVLTVEDVFTALCLYSSVVSSDCYIVTTQCSKACYLQFHICGKHEQIYEQSEEFQKELKLKVREILTDQEWRRRKMVMRISEEEGRLKKDEEEQKEIWKKKREHEAQWEGTRENRVSSWRDFMKAGKKAKKGETRPPKLKTEDPNKSYVQRPVKKG
ncbi:hypothetical protein IGI04_009634 [Brassica rapa subsp. trilocularis]|uniref:FAF domain-containing protein n=1 Tax=Brassica rapa subsp. trilocularis TaxID=1813537 RepID=A0ABQ7MXV2_BRACM|nr:hypothetical protein IGI04_009634 [Brassica rapa subsp. trilocularis]